MRVVAGLVLVTTGLLIAWGLAVGSIVPAGYGDTDVEHSDVGLYQAISARIADGSTYYDAVEAEQPARGYPISPVMTVREPTLAWTIDLLGEHGAYAVLLVLAGAAVAMGMYCFDRIARGRGEWVGATLLLVAVIGFVAAPVNVWVHDAWAGLLIVIGVLAATQRWFWPALLALLAACLMRELAVPAVLAVVVVWWPGLGRRRRTAVLAAGAAFAGFYGWHAVQAAGFSATGGSEAPGWLDLHGWPFFVNSAWFSTVLTVLPIAVVAVLVPLALLGWVGRSGVMARPVVGVPVIYAVAFGVMGRSNNLYWGLLFAPLLVPGLAFAPRTLHELFRTARTGRGEA